MDYLQKLFFNTSKTSAQINREKEELINFFKKNANPKRKINLRQIINSDDIDKRYFIEYIYNIITLAIREEKLYILNKEIVNNKPHYSLILQTFNSISKYKNLYDDIEIRFIILFKTLKDDYILIDPNILLIDDDNNYEPYYYYDLINILDEIKDSVYEIKIKELNLSNELNEFKRKVEIEEKKSLELIDLSSKTNFENDDNLTTLLLNNVENNDIYLYNILISINTHIDFEKDYKDYNINLRKKFELSHYDDNVETLKSYYIKYLKNIIKLFIDNRKLYILDYDKQTFFLKQIIDDSAEMKKYIYEKIYEEIYNGDYYLFKTKNDEFLLIKKSRINRNDFDIIIKNVNKSNSSTIKFVISHLNYAQFIDEKDYNMSYYDYEFKRTHNLIYMNRLYNMLNAQVYKDSEVAGGNKNKYQIHTNKKTNTAYINYNNKKYYFYKSNNKTYIKINNKIIYLTNKSLSYNKNINTYFIKI